MKCVKCNGVGTIEAYKHVANGKCFSCNGDGLIEVVAAAPLESIGTAVAIGAVVYAGKKIIDKWEQEEAKKEKLDEINANHTLTKEEEDYFKELLGANYQSSYVNPSKEHTKNKKAKASKQTFASIKLISRMPR